MNSVCLTLALGNECHFVEQFSGIMCTFKFEHYFYENSEHYKLEFTVNQCCIDLLNWVLMQLTVFFYLIWIQRSVEHSDWTYRSKIADYLSANALNLGMTDILFAPLIDGADLRSLLSAHDEERFSHALTNAHVYWFSKSHSDSYDSCPFLERECRSICDCLSSPY